ncbi:MAG: hypothetical protein JSS23_02995 [Proteobacteria bacterium]|nr:hypothetical protein [Pseudomonadota bacterium]
MSENTQPTDAEILAAVAHLGFAQLSPIEVARAVLARWGAPQPKGDAEDDPTPLQLAGFEAAERHAAATMELRRMRMALGCEPGDGPPPDPVVVIQMLQSREVDATRRAELMEQHLRAVLEVARTWQPDYATKMDRDTLKYAQDYADGKPP